MNKQTGWVNATKFCDEHDKRFRNWTQNKQTKDLISVFSNEEIGPMEFQRSKITNQDEDNSLSDSDSTNESDRSDVSGPNNWSILVKGGKRDSDYIISGTYIHPDLVPALAMWISPSFHLKACKILNKYITKFWKENSDKLMEKCEQMAKEMERKLTENDDLANVVENLLDNVVHKPKNDNLLQTFLLFKLNNPLHKFQFATSRCQKRSVTKAKKEYLPNIQKLKSFLKWDIHQMQ